jgi:hypothetical protein
LYKAIELSWNYKFQDASTIFKTYLIKDPRHALHSIELNMFKILITGKKSLIDKSMNKLVKLEEMINGVKASMAKIKSSTV